jgi:hypothetical protein
VHKVVLRGYRSGIRRCCRIRSSSSNNQIKVLNWPQLHIPNPIPDWRFPSSWQVPPILGMDGELKSKPAEAVGVADAGGFGSTHTGAAKGSSRDRPRCVLWKRRRFLFDALRVRYWSTCTSSNDTGLVHHYFRFQFFPVLGIF